MCCQYQVHDSLKLGQAKVEKAAAVRNQRGINTLKNRSTSTNVQRLVRWQERLALALPFSIPTVSPPHTEGTSIQELEFTSLHCNQRA